MSEKLEKAEELLLLKKLHGKCKKRRGIILEDRS